jgi:tetratricopeptide (TPR) repeat protein
MRLPIRGMLVFVALLASAPAYALNPLWDQCKDVNNEDTADKSLSACTRLLEDRSEAKNHAMVLRNRCGIWYTKKDYDHALTDCNQAIKMEPKSAIAYNRRGLIWYAKGDNDRAIEDFDRAIRIDSAFAYAYYNRGLAWGAKGDKGRADADETEAIRLDPSLKNR